MTELQNVLDRYLDMELLQIVLSGARTKDGVSRIRIRPVIIREELLFQCTKTAGTKELHENLKKSEALLRIDQWLREDFRQLQLESGKGTVNALSSKKGKITVKEKKNKCTESEMLEMLNLERSRYYDKKKEAIMVFGLALWGAELPKVKEFLQEEPDESLAVMSTT